MKYVNMYNKYGCHYVFGIEESYNCINGKCVKETEYKGRYNTLEECEKKCDCETYNCKNGSCEKADDCKGDYDTKEQCEAVCDCNTYDCIKDSSGNTNCVKADGCDGKYNSLSECQNVCDCTTYDCKNGECIKATGCDGQYNSLTECQKDCHPCQECGWISVYDNRLQQSVAGDKYCDNDCGYGFTQYYSDTGNYYDSGGGPFNAKCIDGCLNITKADVLAHDYVAFIQHFSPKTYPTDAPCSSYCKGSTVSSKDPISPDKKWYIQFPKAKTMDFEIHNQQQDPQEDICHYQLSIYKGCDTTPLEVIQLPPIQLKTNPVYKGVADEPYRFYLEFATPIIVYRNNNYDEHLASLEVGNYKLSDLELKGISDNNIGSIKVNNGYKITIFEYDNFEGNHLILLDSSPNLILSNWFYLISSIKVEVVSS